MAIAVKEGHALVGKRERWGERNGTSLGDMKLSRADEPGKVARTWCSRRQPCAGPRLVEAMTFEICALASFRAGVVHPLCL